MAVSQIEERILGRLAKQAAPTNALLSASLYQILGLSILLSRKLYRARKQRKLDYTRDTKSLLLYHHIIWLAREGLSITEVYILPYCQDGEQGPECRVMAAKLRASLYHVFCLFHNHPPISQLSARSFDSGSPGSGNTVPHASDELTRDPSKGSPKKIKEQSDGRRRVGKAPLRDPIPSTTSDASYVTNPYAPSISQTPPIPTPGPGYGDARRTPVRPPGLAPINVSASQAAASFLLPPLNFVPMAKEHFDVAQSLANELLPPTHALRLAVSLEHAAFLWDCTKEHEQARRLARRAIRNVYASSDDIDDEEFTNASVLVQALGGIVRRGSATSTPQARSETVASPSASQTQLRTIPAPLTTRGGQPIIDRTIAVSPANNRRVPSSSPAQSQSYPHYHHQSTTRAHLVRSPERLSTVPEVDSVVNSPSTVAPLSPPISRLSSRPSQRPSSSRRNTVSSVTSSGSDPNKAAKRRAAERAEEEVLLLRRQRTHSNASSTQRSIGSVISGGGSGGDSNSRQATPPVGYYERTCGETGGGDVRRESPIDASERTRAAKEGEEEDPSGGPTQSREQRVSTSGSDRQQAVIDALRIMALSSSPLYTKSARSHGSPNMRIL